MRLHWRETVSQQFCLRPLSDLRVITLICLPLCLRLSVDCSISVVRWVDLLHLTAPLLPGREQCIPIGCQPDQLECLLSSEPCSNTHKRQTKKMNAYTDIFHPFVTFFYYFLLFRDLLAPEINPFIFWQIHILPLSNDIYRNIFWNCRLLNFFLHPFVVGFLHFFSLHKDMGTEPFSLFSLQSSSPIPTKRRKFDKLQSPSADGDRKPHWLQSLSKSAQKVCAL